MAKNDPSSYPVLRRYTSLPSLLHLLQNQAITLLSPALWEDRNDAYYMSQYKARKALKSLLALCFADAKETYHHWRVFTEGSEGVCISFSREKFMGLVEREGSIRPGYVKYKKIAELRAFRPELNDLPFLKRDPYEDETEFRLIYENPDEERDFKSFKIDLKCIDRVTLNPWLARPLVEPVKQAIKAVRGCSRLPVYQTTLLENEKWKTAAHADQS
jgi:hypothetical protein